jgi:hypothetical protein
VTIVKPAGAGSTPSVPQPIRLKHLPFLEYRKYFDCGHLYHNGAQMIENYHHYKGYAYQFTNEEEISFGTEPGSSVERVTTSKIMTGSARSRAKKIITRWYPLPGTLKKLSSHLLRRCLRYSNCTARYIVSNLCAWTLTYRQYGQLISHK